jgi:hypothetical protein
LDLLARGPQQEQGYLLLSKKVCACPLCNVPFRAPALEEALAPIDALRSALAALLRRGGANAEDLAAAGHAPFPPADAPLAERDAALQRVLEVRPGALDFYPCFKCRKPYFGGERQCQRDGEGAHAAPKPKPEDLVCAKCMVAQLGEDLSCKVHGGGFQDMEGPVLFKCRFCCNEATFLCWGTTHFCKACHTQPYKVQDLHEAGTLPPCCGPFGVKLEGPCPLGGGHRPSGEEHCLGCRECYHEARQKQAAFRRGEVVGGGGGGGGAPPPPPPAAAPLEKAEEEAPAPAPAPVPVPAAAADEEAPAPAAAAAPAEGLVEAPVGGAAEAALPVPPAPAPVDEPDDDDL